MSSYCSAWAWDQCPKLAIDKLVLIKIGDNSNDEGESESDPGSLAALADSCDIELWELELSLERLASGGRPFIRIERSPEGLTWIFFRMDLHQCKPFGGAKVAREVAR